LRVAIERGEGLLVEHLQSLGLEVFCVSPKIAARAPTMTATAQVRVSAGTDAKVATDSCPRGTAQGRSANRPGKRRVPAWRVRRPRR
jgi:hypothetical protein